MIVINIALRFINSKFFFFIEFQRCSFNDDILQIIYMIKYNKTSELGNQLNAKIDTLSYWCVVLPELKVCQK